MRFVSVERIYDHKVTDDRLVCVLAHIVPQVKVALQFQPINLGPKWQKKKDASP